MRVTDWRGIEKTGGGDAGMKFGGPCRGRTYGPLIKGSGPRGILFILRGVLKRSVRLFVFPLQLDRFHDGFCQVQLSPRASGNFF